MPDPLTFEITNGKLNEIASNIDIPKDSALEFEHKINMSEFFKIENFLSSFILLKIFTLFCNFRFLISKFNLFLNFPEPIIFSRKFIGKY